MSIVSLLAFVSLVLLSYAGFYFSRLVYGDYFAPVGLFIGINLASLSLYQLDLLPLTHISFKAYTLIAASLFSFLIGVLMASPFFILKKKPLARQDMFNNQREAPKGLTLFYYLTASLAIAVWIFYVTTIVPSGWLLKPWLLQGTGQSEYIIPYHMGYLLVSGALVPPTFVLLALARHRITLPSVCFLLGDIIALGLCGIKSYLVIGLGTSLLVWSVSRPGRVRLKHLAIFAGGFIGFMAIYDRFIDIFTQVQYPGSKFPATLSFLERPYLYIVGSWPAMSAVIINPPMPAHWGQVTLEPYWKILGPGGLGIMERISSFLPFVNIGVITFNVYSLIGELYFDYGWLGSIVGCFFLGFVSTRLYITARKHRNWIFCLLSAIFSYGLLISLFVYYYRSNLIFLLLYTLIIGWLSKRLSIVLKWRKTYIPYSKSTYREAVL